MFCSAPPVTRCTAGRLGGSGGFERGNGQSRSQIFRPANLGAAQTARTDSDQRKLLCRGAGDYFISLPHLSAQSLAALAPPPRGIFYPYSPASLPLPRA